MQTNHFINLVFFIQHLDFYLSLLDYFILELEDLKTHNNDTN